ncbi:FAD-dependent oxidoreductase [Rhodoligotrophos ferricapiens]|uniref:oxidoreductase n=1 Tax=Rhodoligotrophos ferricapiens TaxID=3069264 RepID=UPI00315D0863
MPGQTQSAQPFPKLFEPIRLGSREARNRIMRVATTAHLAERNRVGDRMLEFYRTLAQGGAGVIVTEGLRVHPFEAEPAGAMLMWDRASIPGMHKLTKAVTAEGALFIGQLNHGGRQHLGRFVPPLMVAPSAIPCPRSGGVPHALTTEEIEDLIEWFATSAMHCIEAGMDGVEIHGAQGHLIQQFVSPYSNHRDDLYGGSFENRIRFPLAIIAAVRKRIGSAPIVGYRLGVDELTAGGLGVEETKRLAEHLSADGLVSYVSLSQGNFNTIDIHLPERHFPMVPYRELQAQIKPAAGELPVVMCTRIQTPEQGEDILAAGEADMIGFCRAFIVDPHWPKAAKAGRAQDIRRCIACNQCWGWISEGGPIGCAVNPTLGLEYKWGKLERAWHRKKVLVVGGGPGGLEAARIAGLRGHHVTLIEKSTELGGRLKTARLAPHFSELQHVLDYLVPQVQAAGVETITGQEADYELIEEHSPDCVVLATGAMPHTPALTGDGSVPVLTSDGIIDVAALRDGTIIIMDEDGYFWPAAVAEAAAQLGRRVVFATRFFEPFREMPMVSRIATLRELDRRGVEMRANMAPISASNGSVALRHYQSGREELIPDCAALFWVGLQQANDGLSARLRANGFDKKDVMVIGDAFAPRRLPQALREGHAAGRSI